METEKKRPGPPKGWKKPGPPIKVYKFSLTEAQYKKVRAYVDGLRGYVRGEK
jgi:hypothetical protein